MIPLRDSVRPRRRAWANYTIIAANVAVFIWQLMMTRAELTRFVAHYAVVPALLWQQPFGPGPFGWPPPVLSLITAAFIHGGWVHLGGNMLYLWVFGDNVEDRLGHLGFLSFYLVGGAVANLAHAVANFSSPLPALGASGAVAAVLGAYLVAFPRARVLALIPLGFFIRIAEVPAVFFLALWFLLQFVSGLGALGAGAGAGVAWWAHIGGFVAGIAAMWPLRMRGR